ncbi:hypothetical protein DFS34DRAFT_282893 [Phlyctochytrium arcticum]|nr:hypothetical protein DFS34DRAFT_282893 [Phlyctochytrium arcticum]
MRTHYLIPIELGLFLLAIIKHPSSTNSLYSAPASSKSSFAPSSTLLWILFGIVALQCLGVLYSAWSWWMQKRLQEWVIKQAQRGWGLRSRPNSSHNLAKDLERRGSGMKALPSGFSSPHAVVKAVSEQEDAGLFWIICVIVGNVFKLIVLHITAVFLLLPLPVLDSAAHIGQYSAYTVEQKAGSAAANEASLRRTSAGATICWIAIVWIAICMGCWEGGYRSGKQRR